MESIVEHNILTPLDLRIPSLVLSPRGHPILWSFLYLANISLVREVLVTLSSVLGTSWILNMVVSVCVLFPLERIVYLCVYKQYDHEVFGSKHM